MPNPQAQWRIDFAQRLAQHLRSFEGIQAIVIAGSVARGYADEYSDIEIPIFWENLPSDATRRAVARALNAKFLFGYDGPAHEDQLLIDGVQVDLWDVSIAHQEEILDAVLSRHEYDLGTLNALDTVRTCIPLVGHELIQLWKERAQAYPDGLAEKMIRDHLGSFRIGELHLLARRDNPTAFYARLSFLQQEVFLVLLALNRCYFPTYKWMYAALTTMPIQPEAIESRFRKAYEVPYSEVIADTKRLLEETVALVEDQFPQMDMEFVKRRLAYFREPQFTGKTDHPR